MATEKAPVFVEVHSGEECPICLKTGHKGLWDGEKYAPCYVCADTGVLDEKSAAFLNDFQDRWDKTPPSEQERIALEWRSAEVPKSDSPESFRHFFWCASRMELPDHAYYGWVVPIYYAHGRITIERVREYFKEPSALPFRFLLPMLERETRRKIGAVIQSSRYFAKTIVLTIYWTAYRIGKEPYRANLILQIGDSSAKLNAAKVAEIIDSYSGWKKCFPHVVPNKDKKWGADGYEVIDISKTPEEWAKLNSGRKDETLLGLGYNSHLLNGRHPDGVATVDDIHDESNTYSEKELNEVLRIIQSIFFYCITPDTWVTFIGTPYVENDTLEFVKGTGEYLSIVMPAYLEKVDGKLVAPKQWAEETEKVFLWPTERSQDWVRTKYKTSTPQEFKRMILLNLEGGFEQHYVYQTFPHKEIDWNWPAVAGVDPVGTVLGVSATAGTSHFALVLGMRTPFMKLVITKAIVEKCGAEEGERYIVEWQKEFRNYLRASIELNGVGAIFIALLARNPGIKISRHPASDIGSGPKAERQYRFLEPLFRNGLVQVSDEDSPGLRMVRRYLDRWPAFLGNKASPELDVGDAITQLVIDMPEIYTQATNILGGMAYNQGVQQKNPYSYLASYKALK